ncbi:5-methyltetrahydropteroyltriglutamate--homocysteine methyltransferase [Pseudomonas mandelii JR-1]|uniref:5-methyltetrahydropteroyltriglutamate--homocysteine methyltransferase n=1 Tax=Pseudomonas mandelii JR-1 TaxID=1147786 RepID=A0A024EHK9_9PSED|nr:5-methyltetrahydropteroyltriglutamate--homocysteine methyltransferase [Pseudomonas mandelii JR-1]
MGQSHGEFLPVKDGAIVDSQPNMRQTQPFRVDHKFSSWSPPGA